MVLKCNCMINMCLLKYDSPDVICAAKVGQKLSGHVSFSIWILGKHVFQELQEYLCVIFLVFLHIYMSGFIVQKANQFHSFMFSVCRYDSLFPFGKPCFHNGLIIANHGFIFKQDCGNITFQQFFLMFQMFF